MAVIQTSKATAAESEHKLPVDGYIALSNFDHKAPVYASTSLLVQQIAYLLSDKVFSYSPESFNLDSALTKWQAQNERNIFDFVPGVTPLQTRLGAGSFALGYVFSPDFDLSKRHIPQSIVASAGSLLYLREALNQLSLLHALANPIVLHVSSTGYNKHLTADFVAAQELADQLGFGLVNGLGGAKEAQHAALLSTLLATAGLPTVNIYDGLTGHDTVLISQHGSRAQIEGVFAAAAKELETTETKHLDAEGKALKVFKLLNDGLGTSYKPFEYHGHTHAKTVFVTFGSSESAISAQIASALSVNGQKVGVVNVRLYRPFVEEGFVQILPESTSKVVVLGQVQDLDEISDESIHSRLYQDVFATLTFSAIQGRNLDIVDEKYAPQQVLDFVSISAYFAKALGSAVESLVNESHKSATAQITLWTLDDSPFTTVADGVASFAATLPKSIVSVHKSHDNLVQGGVSRSDISTTGCELPFTSNLTFIGSEKILGEYNVLHSTQENGAVVISLPGVKTEDLEKKLPATFRADLFSKKIRLYVLDTTASPLVVANKTLAASLLQLSIRAVLQELYIPAGNGTPAVYNKLGVELVEDLAAEIPLALRQVEVSELWQDAGEEKLITRTQIVPNSFVPFDQSEEEPSSELQDWIIAAQGAVFKEAYGTKSSLRPDTGVKTALVHVKEHRRLTPLSYERNVFHIEFDLGDSGLSYAIGEALGIHAENDPEEVQEFIKIYGLNPAEVVQVPSRDDPLILENRTVYQALVQNVDIFGRPPKRFYESLAEFATDESEKKTLLSLLTPAGAEEFKRRAEVDTVTFADVLAEFSSAHPSFHDIIRIVSPLKRREYSIASSQHVTPTSVSLLIVTVNWFDPKKRERFGLATRYLNALKVGAPVTVSVKPSVMKLPQKSTAPIIMAGLGTGLAPFRAFVQERAYQRDVLGQPIGSVLLYLGSRHKREEYLYGEEWEAYAAAGVITLIGAAFSRDQPQKIYIQDRMRQTLEDIRQAYVRDEGSFYLCGPTWPVPDVTEVLQEAVEEELKSTGVKRVDGRREIETLKDAGRFVLEVY